MVTTYPVKLSVTLRPVQHSQPLLVRIGIDQNLSITKVNQDTTINFEFESDRDCVLSVELLDKQDQESVVIESVSFFGITDPRFVWSGVYEPEYPEPWATQQRDKGVVLKPQLSPHTYLSWPGKWTLTFAVPVFTWMHQVQDLGWIYD